MSFIASFEDILINNNPTTLIRPNSKTSLIHVVDILKVDSCYNFLKHRKPVGQKVL